MCHVTVFVLVVVVATGCITILPRQLVGGVDPARTFRRLLLSQESGCAEKKRTPGPIDSEERGTRYVSSDCEK